MKKILIPIFVAMVLFLLYKFFFLDVIKQDKTDVTQAVDKEIKMLELATLEDEGLLTFEEDNLSVEDIDSALKKEQEADSEVEPKMVNDEHMLYNIMLEANMDEVNKEITPKSGIDPIIAIKVEKESLKNLKKGDRIALPYMGMGEYEAQISSKTIHKNGSVSVTGNIVGSNGDYSVVLTEGKNSMFGSITTKDGAFEIETINGKGYVYSVDEIDREWIDYGKKDTLEPDGHG